MERTAHHTMKIRQLSTGLVFERQSPDARELVATGGFAFAGITEESIVERLAATPESVLRALPGQRLHEAYTHLDRVAALVPLVEAGAVSLP